MKKALISPNERVEYISSWVQISEKIFMPQITVLENAARIAEVADNEFEVGSPLFWVECGDSVVADVFYFDLLSANVLLKPENAEHPINTNTGN